MIRGTTASFRFKLPYKKSDLKWATIKFWQEGNYGTLTAPLPITKTLEDCLLPADSKEMCVSLTVDETLRFSDKLKLHVQLGARLIDEAGGGVFASHEKLFTVHPIRNGIITDDPTEDAPIEDGLTILDGGHIILQGGDE